MQLAPRVSRELILSLAGRGTFPVHRLVKSEGRLEEENTASVSGEIVGPAGSVKVCVGAKPDADSMSGGS